MIDGEFDEHRDIVYSDITKLYWNAYPYKVKVSHRLSLPRDRFCGTDPTLYHEWKEARKTHLKFFYQRRRHCPEDISTYKAMDNGIHALSCSFFFLNAKDAMHFITKNKRHVTEVFRPSCPEEVKALGVSKKMVLRDTLFWNRYRYCIEFKEQPIKAENALDERVLEFFNNRPNKRRYLYTYSKRRRLYLTEPNDILAVFMALHHKFRTETHVILKEEIK